MIIGTAGHIDHGKTSLVRALTGIETDRLKEEKARGISIDLGFAYRTLENGARIGFIDVPGHERFIHTMLAGVGGIDFALLVVAADDGVMPQTREHLAIIDLLGIRQGIVAITKSDLVTEDRLLAVEIEIEALLAGTSLEAAEILAVSNTTGAGVATLEERLASAALAHGRRSASGCFRLAVDRSFVIQGTGTVVTGTVLSGEVGIGDAVTVSPSGLGARVRSIHAQNEKAERGRAGDRCALNLTGEGIGRGAIMRGDMVVAPALHAPTARIDAELKVLASEAKPVGQWFPVHLHHAASEIPARVVLLRDEPIAPGEQAFVQLVLERPLAGAAGDRFVIRDTSARRTIGGGRFLDLRAPSRRRRSPERRAQLEAMAITTPSAALARLLDAPPYLLDIATFARDRALGEDETAALASDTIRIPPDTGSMVMAPARWLRLRQRLLADLDAYHAENPDQPGIGLERLRMLGEIRPPAPVFRMILQGLQRRGEVSLDGAWVRRPGHVVRFSAEDEGVWGLVKPHLTGEERFRPPRTRDFATMLDLPEARTRAILKRASRMGLVHEVAHDFFFARPVMAEIVTILRDVAAGKAKGEFIAADLRDRLENGRKVSIEILEFLDRHGVTLRRGDIRRLNPHRLDLFGQTTAGEDNGRESSPVGRPDFKFEREHPKEYRPDIESP
ncbi:selenocysteine-specific translation elongation factor [Aquamicrobium sp. LC103]|uniref:selenocysteine-specific translation elongation factor n=1 Tax=Aquamicrobium sp. LC103 TaxID=1120658 RepID=UPI00063ECD44|nr:selenocysteine-specific translation elongation factor [Aquamicrobium sp. LC103]TKT69101.1 selenocysteine-specific translation elongation factor [Aquamicrobium sp. LC103]